VKAAFGLINEHAFRTCIRPDALPLEIHDPPRLMALVHRSLSAALLLWCACVSTAAESLRVVKLFGGRYVSLQQWAARKGFTFDWDQPGKTVKVNISWAKMTFNIHSKRANINENTIWLCHSVTVSGGTVYISERDIEKTLDPILFPELLPKGAKIRTVMIAAGHGGKDPGYIFNRAQEKKYTLLMAKALKEALREAGFKVLMTRERDVFIDLEEQAFLANRARADLFVTVHYNAVSDTAPNGIETFCLTPAGAISTNGGTPSPSSTGNRNDALNALLTYKVHKEILLKTDFADRGIRRAGFLVLRHLRMPGILIEGGFLSHPSDAKKIHSAAHRKVVAKAIADGILSMKSLVER
jgi:N-acetylmuramoyl-L-alanine amidase